MNKRRKINLILGTGGSIIAGLTPVGFVSATSGNDESRSFNHFASEVVFTPSTEFNPFPEITNVGAKKYYYKQYRGHADTVRVYYNNADLANNISKVLLYYKNEADPSEKHHVVIVDRSNGQTVSKAKNESHYGTNSWKKIKPTRWKK